MRLNIMFRHSLSTFLGVALMCSFVLPSEGRADDSFWEASTVDWWVAQGSDQSDQCQIHWLFDDEIDVYFQRSHKGYFYFGFDDGDTKLFSTRSKDLESYLVVDSKEYQLSVEKVNGSVYVAPLPAVFNDLIDIRNAEVLLLVLGNNIHHFPLENSDENFKVYKTCVEDNNEIRVAIKESEADLTPPVAVETVSEKSIEALSPVVLNADPNISVAETLSSPASSEIDVSASPVDLSPKEVSKISAEDSLFAPQTSPTSDYLVPSRISDAAKIERSKITDGKPLNIAPLGEDKAGNVSRWDNDKEDLSTYFTEETMPAQNQYDQRVSKTPQINKSETIDSVIKSLEPTKPAMEEEPAQVEQEMTKTPADDLNSVATSERRDNETKRISETQDIAELDLKEKVAEAQLPQEEQKTSKVTDKKSGLDIAPEPAPIVEKPEILPEVAQDSVVSDLRSRLAIKQADSTKRAIESMEASSDIIDEKIEQKLEGCNSDKESNSSPNYGSKTSLIINNLTRKLSVLEKEKESLRKKLLAVNGDPVLSEIVACNTQPEEQEQEVLDEEMIQEFENIINNLRAENELLNAAVLDGEVATGGQDGELENRVSALQAQINELKLVNSDLSREITEYQKIIEESEPSQPDPEDMMPEDVDVDSFVQGLSEERSDGNSLIDFNDLDGFDVIEETTETPKETIEDISGEEVIENIENFQEELLLTE